MTTVSDLGFTYSARKNGDVAIMHHGRLAATLRGAAAANFIAQIEDGSEAHAQQLFS